MSPKRLVAWIALSLSLGAGMAAQAPRQTLRVSSASELLAALAPHRTIVLAPGDYLLSSAYGVSNPFVHWYDSEDGKELALQNLEDVELRGEAGARIVTESSTVYVLDLYGCKNLTLENLVLQRRLPEGTEISGGGLYVENCETLSLLGLAFEGGNGYPLEVRDSQGLRVRASAFRGGFYGALYLADSHDLRFEASTVEANSGDPLLSLEESRDVGFSAVTFRGNKGGTFLGLYEDKVKATGIGFEGCAFDSNTFDYFVSSGSLPSLSAPTFTNNSFGADWAEASVAPPPDASEETVEMAVRELSDSGLTVLVPSSWTFQEAQGATAGTAARVGIFSPDGQALCLFLPLGLSPGVLGSPGGPGRALQAALDIMKTETGTDLELRPDADLAARSGSSLAYRGRAIQARGAEAVARLRIAASPSGIYALLALAADESLFLPEGELDAILSSLSPVIVR